MINAFRRNICICPTDSNKDPTYWNWSNPFEITGIGSYKFLLYNKDRSEKKFFKVAVDIHSAVISVTIEEEPVERVRHKVHNTCKDMTIKVYQSCMNPINGVDIAPGEIIPWAWVYPNKKKEIAIDFILSDLTRYHLSDFKFSLDAINKTFNTEVPFDVKQPKTKVHVKVVLEGESQILTFSTPNDDADIKIGDKNIPIEVITNMTIGVTIKSLGISVISKFKDRVNHRFERREALYMQMNTIRFAIIDTTENNTIHFGIKYFNIDNNTIYDTTFPVLITPTKPIPDTVNKYFIDVLIQKKNFQGVNNLSSPFTFLPL